MKLSTIWTLRGMSLRERCKRTSELWWFYTAPRFLPQRLRYGVLIVEGVRHIANDEVVPEVPFMAILERSGADVAR
jgi:hypothetical protein